MNLEDTKENIQPLRGGRNVEQLEYAFVSPERWEEERKANEEALENYEGDDPLEPWYNYFYWMEQTNVSNFKPAIQEQALRRCVQKFENDPRYMQDHRFIKLCIKYIDAQASPVELYNELYLRGVGTLCSELYIAWAYYYDAVDNFAKTEDVFQKGLRAGAEPKADLEQAHTTFGFSMSQRLLHKDESSKLKFQTILGERRNALTSLKASRKKHVGSIRTGLAVKSYQPGRVNQENVEPGTNAPTSSIVFSDDPGQSEAGPSIVRPFSSVHSEPENIIEAARFAKSNALSQKKPALFGMHQAPCFHIPEDEEIFEPLPVIVENYSRGIVLSRTFCPKNNPQTAFNVDICVGEQGKEKSIPMYDKIRLYCRTTDRYCEGREKTEFSPEELRAYRYFMRQGKQNRFTNDQAQVWGQGYDVGIRLHPLHVSSCTNNNDKVEAFQNPSPEELSLNIETKIREMYSNTHEERSIEELLVEKWLKGDIKKCIDRRYQDDIDPVDMDETHVESKRISMGMARFSMAPPLPPTGSGNNQPQTSQRKSIFPTRPAALVVSCIQEETEEELQNRSTLTNEKTATKSLREANVHQDGKETVSRKRLSNDVLQQEVFKKEDSTPTPLKAFVANDAAEKQLSNETSPTGSPVRTTSQKIAIFVDDSDENDEQEVQAIYPKPLLSNTNEQGQHQQQPPQPYFPNDTCSTQMFNFFVKNISTPVAPVCKQLAPLSTTPTNPSTKRMVVYEDDVEAENEAANEEPGQPNDTASKRTSSGGMHAPVSIPVAIINDENAVPESITPPSTSSGCSSMQNHKQLSTIMERTESSTASSTAAVGTTKCSVDLQGHSPDINFNAVENTPSSISAITSTLGGFVEQPKKFGFPLPGDDGKGFCIHIDSTETMANIPLVKRQPLPAATPLACTDNKENELVTRATGAAAGRGGIFHLSEEATCSGFGFAGTIGNRDISHMVQRELDVNSIASFRMGTERTNTVPLQLVKPQNTIPEVVANVPSSTSIDTNIVSNGSTLLGGNSTASTIVAVDKKVNESPKKRGTLSALLDATFSPKLVEKENSGSSATVTPTMANNRASGEKFKENSFNLSGFAMSPKSKLPIATPSDQLSLLEPVVAPVVCADLSLLPMDQIKVENSLNIEASIALPKCTVNAPPQPAETIVKVPVVVPVERVVLDDFPSPLPPPGASERASFDDINTAVFSLNIKSVANSTIIPENFKTPCKQSSKANVAPPLKIANVKSGLEEIPSFLKPQAPPPQQHEPQPMANVRQQKSISPVDRQARLPFDPFVNCDADVSIYHSRPAISQDAELWPESEEPVDAIHSNEYQHKTINMDCTMDMINAHKSTEDIDPFERQLQEAFLDRLDFTAYISELPSCLLMNKVIPLRKDVLVETSEKNVAFRVQQKIGKGTYGTVFSATEVSTGKKVALKQERPANLWEYYICLELRSRIKHPDILSGFMPIDYAIIGNNASIFVSPYSQYGNILDVCNKINKATNRNVDEFIAMILTAQMLSIVDHLHSCQIIHADIKPDNFLLMAPVQLNSNIPCIQLIDFGVSIDMKLFQEDVMFKKVITTDGFTCIEMMENKPWTYQPDLFGVAATSHVILFGAYMKVQKNIVNWSIRSSMPRYFKKSVWENFFNTMLNIRDCAHLPNLQKLRTSFLETITLHEKYIQNKVVEFNQALSTCK
ncbi:uncharacterized protein LOC128720188 [Anopheles nili]|uniref:uncharacterized protein LOC128720188 n=1 Tax=Anopheles nili TaxID=185578 RepID=UPI00237A5B2D|nr:uncharacterized protein LOC128720188 [Anopheles nili]